MSRRRCLTKEVFNFVERELRGTGLRDLGEDPKTRGHDGIPLAEIARMNASAVYAEVPADIASWLHVTLG